MRQSMVPRSSTSAKLHSLRVAPLLALLVFLVPGVRVSAQACDPPIANPIVCENALTGNPSSRVGHLGAGDPSIQGFATDISVNHGETVHFKIDTNATDYRIDIYRLGYYGGDGARKVATVQPSATAAADAAGLPDRRRDRPDRLRQLGRVGVVGGAGRRRLGDLHRAARARGRRRPARATSSSSSATTTGTRRSSFQTSDTTWQAYNQYGGNSLYVGGPGDQPGPRLQGQLQPSVHDARRRSAEDWLFNAEYPMVRWLEAQRLQRQLLHRRRHAIGAAPRSSTTRSSCPSVTTSTGPAASAPTSRPRAPRACTSRSSAATRSSGRRAGRPASTAATRRTARSSATRRRTPNAKIDPRPATWTGTWRDNRPVNPRRPSRERAVRTRSSRSTAAATPMTCPARATGSCASGATRASRP